MDNIPPPKNFRPNNKSALSKPTFLWEELVRLDQLGCTKRVSFRPHIVNPCSVAYSKKCRCVLDASICLNTYCLRRKIRLADLSSIPLLLRKGQFITVNNLDSGYWQLPISPRTKHTLAFTSSILMDL